MSKAAPILAAYLLAFTVVAQERVSIESADNVRLASAVFDAVSMGLVKDTMRCDATGRWFTPAVRGYSSVYSSVVRVDKDGKHFCRFSLDGVPGLKNGHVEDFEVEPDGAVYVLARETKIGADLHPALPSAALAAAYVVKFAENGTFQTITRLAGDFADRRPTSLAVLGSGGYLIAGCSFPGNGMLKMFVQRFSADGKEAETISLPGGPTKTSNKHSFGSFSVVRAIALKSEAETVVLRGSGREPVYIFDREGSLVRTVQLKAPGIEFSSPMISGNQLLVHETKILPPSGSITHGYPLEVFSVFDLRSGDKLKQYEWRQPGELACYSGDSLAIVHGDGSAWVVMNARDKNGAATRTADQTGFSVNRIVKCQGSNKPVPMAGDDGGLKAQCLSAQAVVTSADLASAQLTLDEINHPAVRITFTAEGARRLSKATAEMSGEQLAVVIDGRIAVVALVDGPLQTDSLVLSRLDLDREQIQSWVERLKAHSVGRKR